MSTPIGLEGAMVTPPHYQTAASATERHRLRQLTGSVCTYRAYHLRPKEVAVTMGRIQGNLRLGPGVTTDPRQAAALRGRRTQGGAS
jgi:hypothetical protein